MTKAMIFVLHYIMDKVSAAKHVKQSLKKNTSFRAFAVDMNEVLGELTSLGVLTTEQRVKRSRVRNLAEAGDNPANFRERRETYFKLLFDGNNNAKSFLETYQVIFPGQTFCSPEILLWRCTHFYLNIISKLIPLFEYNSGCGHSQT